MKRTTPKLPARRRAFLPTKGPKLSIAQQDYVLSLLAQGYKPGRIRNILREEQGVEIGEGAIRAYLIVHKDELRQRRELWNQEIEAVPLRYRRTRLDELVRLYSLTLREFYRLPCKKCKGVIGQRECKDCQGLGWTLPKDVEAWEIGTESVELDVLRLSQMSSPPRFAREAWDRALECLREIREEVGDSQDKKRKDSTEEMETLSRIAAMTAMKEKVATLTSTEFVGLMLEMAKSRQKPE
jgi:hypothetical protein